MAEDIDAQMERASEALAAMDYLECERLCMAALDQARRQGNWAYYASILLPLQEARRQRRIIAADGAIRLGTSDCPNDAAQWLTHMPQGGCVVVTRPLTASTAQQLERLARRRHLFIEVLLADNRADDASWTLRSFTTLEVQCQVDAPPPQWRDQWLSGPFAAAPQLKTAGRIKTGATPADWFLDALEGLGDAALAQLDPTLEGQQRLEALARCLEVATDHEILHQRLGDAARAMRQDIR